MWKNKSPYSFFLMVVVGVVSGWVGTHCRATWQLRSTSRHHGINSEYYFFTRVCMVLFSLSVCLVVVVVVEKDGGCEL